MTEATRATDELSKHYIPKGISAPSIWVSSFDLLGLFPALLLHTVGETSRVRLQIVVILRYLKVFEERGDFGYGFTVEKSSGGAESG